MSPAPVLDLDKLRNGCARCSLQELCLPAGIDAGDLERLDDIVRRKRPVERGERLFRPGDKLGALFVARSGAFKTVTLGADGTEQVLGFHLPGELMGLDAMGDGEHRVEAVAMSTANVCEVPFEELANIAAQVPRLQQQLLRVIGRSLSRDNDHAAMLVKRYANERIAIFLHALGERFANIGQSSTVFALPMSREEIANFLGLALETVSRGFSKLQEDGLISVSGRRIEILQVETLLELAHGGSDTGRDRRHA